MLADVIDSLACPVCASPLAIQDAAVRCSSGHSFDIARQGYLNLLPGRAHTGTADTAEMVEARDRFLATGAYEPIADVAAAAVGASAPEAATASVDDPAADPASAPAAAPAAALAPIIEVGAGTAYYLARACGTRPGPGIAIDISKHAARRAAKAHPCVGAVVADAWGRLPIKDGIAAAVLDVFSPRNPTEFHRVLMPGGIVVVVVPRPEHLHELVSSLGLLTVDADKLSALDEAFGELFDRESVTNVDRTLHLSHELVEVLIGMGPSARHTRSDIVRAAIAAMPEPVEVTLAVSVAVYRRR